MSTGMLFLDVGIVGVVVAGVLWATYTCLFTSSRSQRDEELRLRKIARQPWADNRRGDR